MEVGIWCARGIVGNGRFGLSPLRLAQFDNPDVTLSSGIPGTPTAVDPLTTPSSTILPADPSSTSPGDNNGNSTDGIPQPTNPAAGNLVTVTVVSTIFLTSTDSGVSLPTQSLLPPSSVVSSIPVVNPSPTVPEDPLSSPVSLSNPAGVFTSTTPLVQEPLPTSTDLESTPSPTIIELTDGIPSSTVSSNLAGQPTPSPTPTTGIIFLPPN